ncbi:NTF2-like protein [Astrocystis sublimbata]|nr:NTF2-like protein [Astrocystis sublimbata]
MAAPAQTPPSAQDNTQKIRAYYQSYLDAYNNQDWDRVQQFYASPTLVDGKSWAPPDMIDRAKSMVAPFTGWRLEIWHFAVDGDMVWVHLKLGGTHTGVVQGVDPTGRRVETTEFALYRLVDGKFVELWPMVNMEGLMQQIQ